jgi:Uma2 family endonuclease
MSTKIRYTIHDLARFPDDGSRYEIIDGDLHVSRQPHWRHQFAVDQFGDALRDWNRETRMGVAISAPGVIFAVDEAVAPDLVWISRERFPRVVGDDGKLHQAPDLVVELLSPGTENEARDRELKLEVYSRRGVREYWIVDWQAANVAVYRREQEALRLVATLTGEDRLTSPLLPDFARRVGDLCAAPI